MLDKHYPIVSNAASYYWVIVLHYLKLLVKVFYREQFVYYILGGGNEGKQVRLEWVMMGQMESSISEKALKIH